MPEQQVRGLHRPAGHDDRLGAYTHRDVSLPGARVDGLAQHADASAALDPKLLDANLGEASRAVGKGTRHVAEERRLFGARGTPREALV